MEHLDKDCECGSKSSPTRDVRNHTGYINAKEVTIASFGAMKSFTPSMVTSNSSLLEPKIEVNLFSEADPYLGSFQQLETQLLDDMEISEQQSSHCPKTEGNKYFASSIIFSEWKWFWLSKFSVSWKYSFEGKILGNLNKIIESIQFLVKFIIIFLFVSSLDFLCFTGWCHDFLFWLVCSWKVFGDDYMHEPGTSVPMPSHGSKNSACLDGKSNSRFHTFTYTITYPHVCTNIVTFYTTTFNPKLRTKRPIKKKLIWLFPKWRELIMFITLW